MKLEMTQEAIDWFQREVIVPEGQGIRFYGKVYGKTEVHDGFSIGMAVDVPEDPLVKEQISDRVFFIEKTDDWFFKGYHLLVDYDQELDEPKYHFEKE